VSVSCHNPARPPHLIADGDRTLQVAVTVQWGDKDLRDDWTGGYVFCSYACLAEYAALRAADHDSVTLTEGANEATGNEQA
jgi:hypothetical protein